MDIVTAIMQTSRYIKGAQTGSYDISICANQGLKKARGEWNYAFICDHIFGKGHSEWCSKHVATNARLEVSEDFNQSILSWIAVGAAWVVALILFIIFTFVPESHKIDRLEGVDYTDLVN